MEPPQPPEMVGRDDEIDVLVDFLERVEALPGVLLIRGEAGIGKTTLWEQGVGIGGQSYRVLSHRASAAEVQLSYAALGDLLADVTADELEDLPGPQRRGLKVALLLEEAGERSPEPRAIAAGFLGSLSRLARTGPLLVAIDDVQWLDSSSATALEFAIRRLRKEPIAFVLAQRIDGETRLPLGFDRGAKGTTRLDLRPLSLGALHRMLTDRIGTTFGRPTMRRLHDVSGGNPFFALELARALQRRGARVEARHPLPLPTNLDELLGDRIAALPATTRRALLAAAALAQPTLVLVEHALGVEAQMVLQPAVEAQVIELDGDAIRFSHPLLASAVYSKATQQQREECHRTLAAIVADIEERAHHLALATTRPDPAVAAAVHEAARRARARGAPAAVAELLEESLRLTPETDEEDWAMRGIEAADAYITAGDNRRAVTLLESVVDRVGPGPLRADALGLLANSGHLHFDRHVGVCEQALREAGSDRQRARLLLMLFEGEFSRGEHRRALEAARSALELAEADGDRLLIARALVKVGAVEQKLGEGMPEARLRRALELEVETGALEIYWAPGTLLGLLLIRTGELEAARELLKEQYRRAVEAGDEDSHSGLCLHLAELECLAGNWDQARQYAEEGDELAEQVGVSSRRGILLYARALVEARVGNVDAARSLAEDGLAIAREIRNTTYVVNNRAVLGFIELSLGRYQAAHAQLGDLPDLAKQMGSGVEGEARIPFVGDEIEALIGLGELDVAEGLLDQLERRMRELSRPPLVTIAGRCRGLLFAARNELPKALSALEEALAAHARLPMPFDRGRTLLALGEVQRRAKQKRTARVSLEGALAIFEELGAKLWAEKARAELARIGGRAPAGGLTPTEQRIAELVAEGGSNKEVAAALFVTVKTVERNLTRIYEKLGVRSRTELASLYATRR